MNAKLTRAAWALPVLALVVCVALLILWRGHDLEDGILMRVPGTEQPPGSEAAAALNPASAGKLLQGPGFPGAASGVWNQFRGPNRNGVSPENTSLAHTWDAAGPRELWAVDCGEGYAGAAAQGGRIYLMDYDADKKQSALR